MKALVPALERPLFDIEPLKELVRNSVSSKLTARAYVDAIAEYFEWAQSLRFSRPAVQAFLRYLQEQGYSTATVNLKLGALRKLASEARYTGIMPREDAEAVLSIKSIPKRGVRTGNWLTKEQVEKLLRLPRNSKTGVRHRAILALLIGCGLRRSELCGLTLEAIQQREGRWVIPDLIGKGNRVRTVTVPAWAKACLDMWVSIAGIKEGKLFDLTPESIHYITRTYGKVLGVPQLAPHDLRRTFAKLCLKHGGKIEQIQLSLGHGTVATTQRYLGVDQDILNAPNDLWSIDLKD